MSRLDEVKQAWETFEQYLVTSRYAIRDPQTGQPKEHTYQDVIDRIMTKLNVEMKEWLINTVHDEDPDKILNLIHHYLTERYFIPATPFLMNYGNPYTKRSGYFSCYPLGYVEDTMDDIWYKCKLMRDIYMHGGGSGIDISKLRSKDQRVDNGQGIASGPIEFLKLFDAVAGSTNQGGRRRGALLVSMDADHPEIYDFIKCKRLNGKLSQFFQTLPVEERPAQNPHLSNMNISVNLRDKDFQNDVLITEIAKSIWASGDPGILFPENSLEHGPFHKNDNAIFVNPCVVGSTPILTKNGYKPIRDLLGQKIEVWNGYEWSKVIPRETGQNQDVVRVQVNKYAFVECTKYHEFILHDGTRVTADKLYIGARLLECSYPSNAIHLYDPIVTDIDLDYGFAEKVYCVNEPLRHSVMFNGILTGNCSEFVSPKYLSCNLLTINVAKVFTFDLKPTDKIEAFSTSLALFMNIAKAATLLGSFIVSLDRGYPDPIIKDQTWKFRPIGIGISGFHTALIHYETIIESYCKYGSVAANEFASLIQSLLSIATLTTSHHLGVMTDKYADTRKEYWKDHVDLIKTKIDNFKDNKNISMYRKNEITKQYNELRKYIYSPRFKGFYNCLTTSQAPTGTISSFLHNLDTGIEPYFAFTQQRRVRDNTEPTGWKSFVLESEYLVQAEENNLIDKDILDTIKRHDTANNLKYSAHLETLLAFSELVHTSVSKTINVPNNTSIKQIKDILKYLMDKKIKGVTIYRDGSLDNIITSLDTKEEKQVVPTPITQEQSIDKTITDIDIQRSGILYTVKGMHYTAHITFTYDNEYRIREVFIQAGDIGSDMNTLFTGLGMSISLALRNNPNLIDKYIRTLQKVRMDDRLICKLEGHSIIGSSLPNVIGQLLGYTHEFVLQKLRNKPIQPKKIEMNRTADICPDCKEIALIRSGNCFKCSKCGYSSC
jgi:ribonucleotide reductase alpha subunit